MIFRKIRLQKWIRREAMTLLAIALDKLRKELEDTIEELPVVDEPEIR